MFVSDLPIGVTDSGIGGLNVLEKLKLSFPNENFLYLGDNANAPYGNKPLAKLKELISCNLNQFLSCGVKGVVIACNTISTTLLDFIKHKYAFFIIPTLPPRPLDNNSFLICTENTANSQISKKLYKNNVVAISGLAKFIEENVFNLNGVDFSPFFEKIPKTAKTIALGCTHYSFIKNQIEQFSKVKTFDGYAEVVVELQKQLKIVGANSKPPNLKFIGDSAKYNEKVYKKVILSS